MTNYLLNVWYVAAWEEEIVGDALLARTLLDQPRLIYRKQDGGYVMLADRCPHRFAPLHMGERHGDSITCLYHGLQFGPNGKCVHSPYSTTPPANARVASTTTVARYGLVWFWPGDPALADPAAVPDFSFLVGQNVWRRHSSFNGNFELLVDNLMDLSHVDYLHRKSFMTSGTHAESVHEVRDGAGATLWNTWLIPRVRKFPVLEPHFPDDTPIDQHTEMRWDPPASMCLRIRWMPTGSDLSATRWTMINPHIITPETATSSHYFWSCEPDADSEAFARLVFDGEDRPMIEAVQRAMGSAAFWDLKPVILAGDVGAVRARRRLNRLIRAERGETAGEDQG